MKYEKSLRNLKCQHEDGAENRSEWLKTDNIEHVRPVILENRRIW